MSPSSILYANVASTILIVDIPSSIGLAQGNTSSTRTLISSPPIEMPFRSTEPKSAKAKSKFPETSIPDVLLQKHIELALDDVREQHDGDWCLPRSIGEQSGYMPQNEELGGRKKRRKLTRDYVSTREAGEDIQVAGEDIQVEEPRLLSQNFFYQNNSYSESNCLRLIPVSSYKVPPHATLLLGPIFSTLSTFIRNAPLFNLIVLDPPWPNRSVKRSKHYSTTYGNQGILTLLHLVPVKEKLAEDGVVAIWITNKRLFREMVVGTEGDDGGLFREWDVEWTEEWVWVKVTKDGRPIGGLADVWRKPI